MRDAAEIFPIRIRNAAVYPEGSFGFRPLVLQTKIVYGDRNLGGSRVNFNEWLSGSFGSCSELGSLSYYLAIPFYNC